MLSEVEEALKEREEDVETRREKNDEYCALKKEVDEQLGKMESGKRRYLNAESLVACLPLFG